MHAVVRQKSDLNKQRNPKKKSPRASRWTCFYICNIHVCRDRPLA